MKRSDLHVHTYMSDGIYSPRKIIEDSIKNNLYSIAITDHDVTEAVEDCIDIADGRLKVIKGIELSCYDSQTNVDVDILGYYIDLNCEDLNDLIAHLRSERMQRYEIVISQLKEKGIKFDKSLLFEYAKGSYIGTYHFIQAFRHTKYIEFAEDENELEPLYFLKKYTSLDEIHTNVTPKDGIEILIKSGGIPVLAHPFRTFRNLSNKVIEKKIDEYVKYGLEGIEIFYPKHSEEQIRFLNDTARQRKLLLTAGSDYHGYHPGDIGQYSIDTNINEALFEILNDSGKINVIAG